MAAHRYWRANFTAFSTGGPPTNIQVAELIFRDTIGGSRVGVPPPGALYASSEFGYGYRRDLAFDNDNGTEWIANGGPPAWLAQDFVTPIEIVELAITSTTGFQLSENPGAGDLSWSDDNATWTKAFDWTVGPFTDHAQTLTCVPVSTDTAGIETSEARTFAIFTQASSSEQVSAGRVFGIIGYPSQGEQVSRAESFVVVKRASIVDVSGARVLGVVRGRIANPKVRAWTFTLDGHDFYVLRLGDTETLVYDVASDKWVEWDSQQSGAWRANTGTTWVGAQRLGHINGSNVVAGDDTFGMLYFLDPELPYDQNPDPARRIQELSFERIVAGQVLAKGRAVVPVFAVFLAGDNYGLTADDFTPAVTLEMSDDQGRTFVNAGALTAQPYEWLSLGQVEAPGRIFRITDNGLLTRIDTLEMNDDAG